MTGRLGRQAGRPTDGAGLHKSALYVPTPAFHAHVYLHPGLVPMHLHANPVSLFLINAHPRNERLIFEWCTTQHSVCTSSALVSNPSPGPRARGTVHINAAGITMARTQTYTRLCCAVDDSCDSWGTTCTVCTGYPQGCPKLVYGKGWASYGGGTDTHTGFASADHLD